MPSRRCCKGMGCQLSAARRGTPAFAGFFAATVTLEDAEVSVGEHYIEPFHTRCVLEATSEDTFFDFDCDIAVESGEITEAALRTAGVCDQIVQMLDDFVDRMGGHTNSYSTATIYLTPLGHRENARCPALLFAFFLRFTKGRVVSPNTSTGEVPKVPKASWIPFCHFWHPLTVGILKVVLPSKRVERRVIQQKRDPGWKPSR